MKKFPAYRPGDGVIDKHGRRGTVVRKHEYAGRRWYDVKFPYTQQPLYRRADELRPDLTMPSYPWPRESNE